MDISDQIKPNPLTVENKWCFNLFDTFHLQAIPFDNEKGYTFISHPCFCYSSLLKDIHTKHMAIGSPMEVFKSDKIRSFYQKIVEQRDFSYCKGCPKYESRLNEGFATAYQLCVYFGLDFAHDLDYQFRKRQLAEQPLTYKVALNLDAACNLHCQTCRDELITKTFNMTDEDIAECIEIAKKSPYLILGADENNELEQYWINVTNKNNIRFEGHFKRNDAYIPSLRSYLESDECYSITDEDFKLI